MIAPSRHFRRAGALWGLAALAVLVGQVQAEVVVLKSGGRVEGELVNPSRTRTQPLVITAAGGLKLALGPAQVQRVIVKKDVERQYEELLPKVANTVDGHWTMAAWCLEAGLSSQRNFHLAEIIRLDPDHAEARRLLGYSRFGEEWLTQEDWMRKQGYIHFQNAWRLPHEIELLKREQEYKESTITWRQDLKRWLSWIESGDRKASTGIQNIKSIRDEAASPALLEILADESRSRNLRLQCLELLSRMRSYDAAATLVKLAMHDRDEEVRDKCLDELRRQRSTLALHSFIKDLKSKDNRIVQRAAYCLGVLEDPEATLPLIDALVTSHKFAVSTSNLNPGQLGAGFGGPTDGSGGGGGSFNFGGNKPKIITQKIKNQSALTSLNRLHPGINFQYDQEAWRKWMIDKRTSAGIDLRRGE